jgi:hypothetical protein
MDFSSTTAFVEPVIWRDDKARQSKAIPTAANATSGSPPQGLPTMLLTNPYRASFAGSPSSSRGARKVLMVAVLVAVRY